ncbi:unnamed protein product [Adineta ricciae]|uniref:Peptidase S1 domain-containing protein n=1 Tax=Adineta ricciae TaxID=249248 RepID=A0A815J6A2_ADIRI|nr:unnamed protein product [Adineta ricciae]
MPHRRILVVLLLFVYLQIFSVDATLFPCNTTFSCGCSRANASINARIVGGEVAVDHSWGWAVSIRSYFGNHFCGGMIISPRYVLTAAHCVEDYIFSANLLSIVIGSNLLNGTDGQRFTLSGIISHPSYNPRTKENDIAILQLSSAIDFKNDNVAKICLPNVTPTEQSQYPIVTKQVVAIGWGHTTFKGNLSNSLQQVTVKTVASKESKCKVYIRNTNLQFCAAVNGGGKDTCQADSGGPLMFYSKSEQVWVLAGITSYGHQCALPDYAGVYTRTSAYISWIQSVVGNDGIVTVQQSKAVIHHRVSYFLTFVVFSLMILNRFYY